MTSDQTTDHITSGRCPTYRPAEQINGLIELDNNTRTWLENNVPDICVVSDGTREKKNMKGNTETSEEPTDAIGVSITAFERKLTLFFSAIPFSRFSLKMSRFFADFESGKKCALCALLSVKWNSDDSATSLQCSAKLIRSAKSATLSLQPGTCLKLCRPIFRNTRAQFDRACHVSVCKRLCFLLVC